MVSLSWTAGCLIITIATTKATLARIVARRDFAWYAPGTKYDGYFVQLNSVYGTVGITPPVENPPYPYPLFTQTTDQQLVYHNKSLCLLDSGFEYSSYWVGDPTIFPSKPPYYSGNNWSTYRGAYLSLGGGYDMFCLSPTAKLSWVPSIPAYESGNSPCEFRGRVSTVGSSVQPAPVTLIPPTSTVSGKPIVQTSTTITPGTTTPGTTEGAGGNSTVNLAYSTAVASARAATSAVNSFTVTPGDIILARAANSTIASALVAAADAAEVAAIAAAAGAVAEPAADAAAVAAAQDALYAGAAAHQKLTPAAPSDFSTAAIAAAAATDAAASANAKQTSSRTTSSSSSSTTSDVPTCVACVACGDAIAPTYTDQEQPTPTDSSTAKRSPRDLRSRAVKDRQSKLCGQFVGVPNYSSWSSGSNRYSPIFNYYIGGNAQTCDGTYTWTLTSANTAAELPAAPAHSASGRLKYVAEHVYEIQEVKIFLLYAANNIDNFSRYKGTTLKGLTDGTSDFCTNVIVPLFFRKTQWAATQYYGTGGTSAISDIYNNLSQESTNDFVFLEAELNGQKNVLMASARGGNQLSSEDITTYNKYLENYALMARTALVATYLNDDRVTTKYKRVSQRIRDSFVKFGLACASSNSANHKDLANIDWKTAYSNWDKQYLDAVAFNMRAYILAANFPAGALIANGIQQRRFSTVDTKYVTTLMLNAQIAILNGPLSASAINLDKLKL